MKRERKIYDPAFKSKAVELSNERSNISELARELGIKVTLLYKWRKEYEEFGEGSFPGKGNLKLTPEQEKIHYNYKKQKPLKKELLSCFLCFFNALCNDYQCQQKVNF